MGSIKKPKFLHWLPQDKWDHLWIGFICGLIGFPMGNILFENDFTTTETILMSFSLALAIGFLVGYAKEKIDESKPYKMFDRMDIVATMAGAFIISVPLCALWLLIK